MNNNEQAGNRQFVFYRFFSIMIFAWGFFLAGQATSFATTVGLQWDAVTDPGVAGYKVYYQPDTSVQPFTGGGATQGSAPIDAQTQTTATIGGLDPAHAYYFAVTAYYTSGVESAYSNIVSVPELVSPTISLSSPVNASTVSGTVSVNAGASDNVGVTKVEYYVNGTLQSTDTSSPYVYSWNTISLAAGGYTLLAKAYDAAGNVGQSANVTVTVVNDVTAPTVSVTAPANNATVSGTTSVTANASDNVAVNKVEFYQNGVLLSATNVSPYSFSWNTTSVANGAYTLSAKAYDVAGNVSQSAAVAVTVSNDTTAPSVAISAPIANATITGTATVTTTASDNVGITRVEFFVNGTLQATDTAAPYSFAWNTVALANGSYTLTVKAYDAAGNVGQSAAVAVTGFNDTAAPTVAISAPTANATVTGTTTVTMTASDNVGITRVEFYVNGVLQATDTAAPYSFAWNTAALANGSCTLTAKSYDAAGNVGQSGTVTVAVNNAVTPPPGAYTAVFGNATGVDYPNTIQDTFINLNNDVNAASPVLGTYTWPANSPANSILMQWDLSGLPANAQIQSATLNLYMSDAGGDSSYQIPVSKVINKTPLISKCTGNTYDGLNAWTPSSVPYNSIPLAQSDIGPEVDAPLIDQSYGYKSWKVTNIIADWVAYPANNKGLLLNASNKASSGSYRFFTSSEAVDANQRPKLVVTYTLQLDSTSPTVSIASPASSATVGGTVSVTANASDNVGVTKVEFYLNGVLQTTDISAPYSYSWNTVSLANGSYTLTTKAYDAAGNVGQSSAVTVTVFNDTIAPTVSVTAPAVNATVTGIVSVTATAIDNVGVTKVEFYVNGALKATDTAAPYSFTWSTTSVANGSYALTTKAYDAAGNLGQSSVVTITVKNDITAPTVSFISPANNATVSGTRTVKVSASDKVGVSRVELYVDGVLKATDTAAPYSFSWDTKSVVNGTHTLTAKAYDAAGNSRTATRTIKVANL